MPKRGSRKWNSDGGYEGGSNYYEHDDRLPRRVTFKPVRGRIGKHSRPRDWDEPLRAQLEDDDVDMAGSSYSNRKNGGRFNTYYRGGRGGGGSNRGRRPFRTNPAPIRKLLDTSTNWYKIIVPHGAHYAKDYLLRTLLSCISPTVFIPISFQVHGSDCSFFVEDAQAAEKLLNIDRQFTLNDGFKVRKLNVKVRNGNPIVHIDNAMKEKLKQNMAKRYNSATKALDLSKFNLDPDIVEKSSLALFRPNVFNAIVDISVENIPDLVALNLSHNGLYSLEHLKVLARKIPSITVLHIGKNKVRDIQELDYLKDLKLQELVLDGNPLCDRFQEQSIYVSEVRKRFPKVIKLDGVDLPPPIVFDVADEQPLPPHRGSFVCSQDGQLVVHQFLEQYYQLYDASSRQGLIDAYHNEALFSMTVHQPNNSARLASYFSTSRNLMRVQDSFRRQKLLYKGKLTIVSTLEQMPKTQHDLRSFLVDLPVYTPQLMVISVTGLFKEAEGKVPVRSFNRVFIIAPFGSGFNIINDELHITSATEEQKKVAFQHPVMPAPSATVSSPGPSIPSSTATSPQQLTDETVKLQMIEVLAQQTGMNFDWSRKCLDETKWDFQNALFVFTELHKQGKVPSDAFIK